MVKRGSDHAMIKGIGIDLVSVDRIRKVMDRTDGFVEKVFTGRERSYCESKADRAMYFAARFAVKEAVMKALGKGLGFVRFQDIEVESNGRQEPKVILKGTALDRFEELGGRAVHISISHEKEYAAAVAVLE
ncbi:MAG: holo-[acyl-carrier-protein] synthase [Deltaproteobacteria bacterium]|nr:holo-[acyl-carrier-protein] synthase [Deltaproteobacteria bacterium]